MLLRQQDSFLRGSTDMKLFVATHNQHKIREISQILPDFEIISDDPEGVEETAPDFIGNAFIKVRAIAAKHQGEWCMADDSGLEVWALGGEPGVRSARYAGEPSNTPNNNALLLKNLAGAEDRTANFTCAIALVDPNGVEHEAIGKCFGHIALEPSGSEGFGYDPLFVPDGHDKSFADLTADEKNAISHRGRALAKAREILTRISNSQTPAKSNIFLSWLRLFRVVNLPTVPGDVLVGAAMAVMFHPQLAEGFLSRIASAALASVFVYMYGLVDNDIVGARSDSDRPIPNGEISIGAARIARMACLLAIIATGMMANLSHLWWTLVAVLLVIIVIYNRTKWSLLMGLCRGSNVLCGVLAGCAPIAAQGYKPIINIETALAPLVWIIYITAVTKFSEGEDNDPGKKKFVGVLIGGIVYLQLIALIVCTMLDARTMPLMIAGGVLLVLLRGFRRVFPKVSAS